MLFISRIFLSTFQKNSASAAESLIEIIEIFIIRFEQLREISGSLKTSNTSESFKDAATDIRYLARSKFSS